MNATKKLAAAIILLIAASAFSITALVNERKAPAQSGNSQSSDLVLYYGNTCPHCKIVEDYLHKNDPSNKLNITQKEVSENTANANELVGKGKYCQLSKIELGAVPLLWVVKNSKCYVGDQPIIDFLKSQQTSQTN